MNSYDFYGTSGASAGYISYRVGNELIINNARTTFSWAFYRSVHTNLGGAKPRLTTFMTQSGIDFNREPHPVAPNSARNLSSTTNHNHAVDAHADRIRQIVGRSLVGDVRTTNASPDMRHLNGTHARDMDLSYRTRNFWTGSTDHYVEVKTYRAEMVRNQTNVGARPTGDTTLQAHSDATNLRNMNAQVRNVRLAGQALRVGGTALVVVGGAYDVYSTTTTVLDRAPDLLRQNSAVAGWVAH